MCHSWLPTLNIANPELLGDPACVCTQPSSKLLQSMVIKHDSHERRQKVVQQKGLQPL